MTIFSYISIMHFYQVHFSLPSLVSSLLSGIIQFLLLSCLFWRVHDLVSVIRVSYRSVGEGLSQEHKHLISGYTTEEHVSPLPAMINCLQIRRAGQGAPSSQLYFVIKIHKHLIIFLNQYKVYSSMLIIFVAVHDGSLKSFEISFCLFFFFETGSQYVALVVQELTMQTQEDHRDAPDLK